jgi:hypothetical protein
VNEFRLMAVALILAATLGRGASLAEDEKGPKLTELKLISATSPKMAKDFALDSTKARETYTPQKAKGDNQLGTYVQVYGKVISNQPGGAIEIEGAGDWKVLARGTMDGSGDYATVTVQSIGVGTNLVLLEGSIKRSAKPPQ